MLKNLYVLKLYILNLFKGKKYEKTHVYFIEKLTFRNLIYGFRPNSY